MKLELRSAEIQLHFAFKMESLEEKSVEHQSTLTKSVLAMNPYVE